MKDLNKILTNDKLNPETKVYSIGKELKSNGKINDYLWYAILELKDKHIKELQLDQIEEDKNENGEPWYYTLGELCEMQKEDGTWVTGKIIDSYRYKDGLITIKMEDGSTLCCFEGYTHNYRKPKD